MSILVSCLFFLPRSLARQILSVIVAARLFCGYLSNRYRIPDADSYEAQLFRFHLVKLALRQLASYPPHPHYRSPALSDHAIKGLLKEYS